MQWQDNQKCYDRINTWRLYYKQKTSVKWALGSSWSIKSWRRHQMETSSALQALCAGNSSVNGEFTAQRAVTRSFEVFFDLDRNKRLNKQSRRRWFETQSRSLWRQCVVYGDKSHEDCFPNYWTSRKRNHWTTDILSWASGLWDDRSL